ncbi:unnamed protein product [Pleuronectes platessa]|uniref:Uncharacterized protein n=1 Tax=Pleuronectes platessa TaxID=8262 RepID=A0A9N7TX99_PLEPL|nr:unnamed protein product [Pleuronectes platessa]
MQSGIFGLNSTLNIKGSADAAVAAGAAQEGLERMAAANEERCSRGGVRQPTCCCGGASLSRSNRATGDSSSPHFNMEPSEKERCRACLRRC